MFMSILLMSVSEGLTAMFDWVEWKPSRGVCAAHGVLRNRGPKARTAVSDSRAMYEREEIGESCESRSLVRTPTSRKRCALSGRPRVSVWPRVVG